MTANDASEIALKWATRLGIGFHPDSYGGDYEPPLSPEEVDDYEGDMGRLFSLCGEDIDPCEVCLDAMRRAGLPVDGTDRGGDAPTAAGGWALLDALLLVLRQESTQGRQAGRRAVDLHLQRMYRPLSRDRP